MFRTTAAATLLLSLAACSASHEGSEVTYCDVKPVFEESCERCHGETPQYGAPISLTTYHQIYSNRSTIEVYVRADIMPFTGSGIQPPVEPLTPDDKQLILDWIDGGAPDCH